MDVVPTAAPLRVVIVEDHEADFVLAREYLQEADGSYEVSWAPSYQEGLSAIEHNQAAAYLIDYHLGADSGLELIQKARAGGSKAPLVMLTGMGGGDVDTEAIRVGASDYLEKDEIRPHRLDRVIRRCIERERAMAGVREAHQRYHAAIEGSDAGIWLWNVDTDGFEFSPRWKDMIGYEPHELEDSREAWFERIHNADRMTVSRTLLAQLDNPEQPLSLDYRIRHRDGSYRWMHMRGGASLRGDGSVRHVAGSQTDITDRKEREREAVLLALRDPLTQLPNRRLLADRMDTALARVAREPGYAFCLLYLDLDGFKPINDMHGHATGDAVLQEVARRLRSEVRGIDTVARVGGDEFVVLLDGCTSRRRAAVVINRIREVVAEPITLRGFIASIGVSIGCAFASDTSRTSAELLDTADQQMYRDKLIRMRAANSGSGVA